jgi:hypothetical protein
MGVGKLMPNWIPVLIVLLTQGASGSIATVHPHDMVRMIQLVARWEESTSESAVSANQFLPERVQSDSRTKKLAATPDSSHQFAGLKYSSSTDLTRDGPVLIS